jgi:hypothetical protein
MKSMRALGGEVPIEWRRWIVGLIGVTAFVPIGLEVLNPFGLGVAPSLAVNTFALASATVGGYLLAWSVAFWGDPMMVPKLRARGN